MHTNQTYEKGAHRSAMRQPQNAKGKKPYADKRKKWERTNKREWM